MQRRSHQVSCNDHVMILIRNLKHCIYDPGRRRRIECRVRVPAITVRDVYVGNMNAFATRWRSSILMRGHVAHQNTRTNKYTNTHRNLRRNVPASAPKSNGPLGGQHVNCIVWAAHVRPASAAINMNRAALGAARCRPSGHRAISI